MAYLGQVDRKASNVQVFNVTSSTSATHDIGWTPPSEQTLIVTINGVKQHTNAFSFSGSTLTLGAALVATDELEVVGINDIGNSLTPVDNSVTASKLANDSVTAAKLGTDSVTTIKIQDDAVTLAKMAGGTDGNLITYDASGDPAYVATGAATNVLTSNGAGAAPTFQAAAAGQPSVISQWNMTTTFTGSVDPIINWSEGAVTGNGNYPATTGVTESAGVFTMASTGYWLITFQAYRSTGGNDQSVYNIRTSTGSGTGWSNRSEAACITYSGHDGSTQNTFVFKCTNTTNEQVAFSVSAASSSNETRGSAGYSTGATFIKLADI
jgi:hypothetical protein